MKKEEMSQQLEFALQQLTGMHASEGRNVQAVVSSMGLVEEEWEELKERNEVEWLTDYERKEIEDYFKDN